MTTQQSEEAATRAWEDSVMGCIHTRTAFWEVDMESGPAGTRWFVQLIPWDSLEPFPAVLDREPCAGYEAATTLATRRNERRARGGTA